MVDTHDGHFGDTSGSSEILRPTDSQDFSGFDFTPLRIRMKIRRIIRLLGYVSRLIVLCETGWRDLQLLECSFIIKL